jgi:alpha-D-xyloside xylohydrolase
VVEGGGWREERHDFTSLPIYVREGAVIARGGRSDRPDYDYLDGLTLELYPTEEGARTVRVTNPDGSETVFEAVWTAESATVTSELDSGWAARLPNGERVAAQGGRVRLAR